MRAAAGVTTSRSKTWLFGLLVALAFGGGFAVALGVSLYFCLVKGSC